MAASGGLGALIPPSTYMVVYASIAGTSVGQQLMAGFMPGILVMFLLIIYNAFVCKRRGYGRITYASEYTRKQKLRLYWMLFRRC